MIPKSYLLPLVLAASALATSSLEERDGGWLWIYPTEDCSGPTITKGGFQITDEDCFQVFGAKAVKYGGDRTDFCVQNFEGPCAVGNHVGRCCGDGAVANANVSGTLLVDPDLSIGHPSPCHKLTDLDPNMTWTYFSVGCIASKSPGSG